MKNDLFLLSSSQVASTLGEGLISTFGLIFFYELLGKSIILAAMPFAVGHLLHAIFLPYVTTHFSSKMGGKSAMILATIFYALQGLTIYGFSITNQWIYLALSTVLYALGNLFYYVPVYFLTGHDTLHSNRARILSIKRISLIVCQLILPLLGGVISQQFNLGGLVLTSIAFYIISILPLIRIKKFYFDDNVALWKTLKLAHARKVVLLDLAEVTATISNAYWPLFVAIVIGASFSDLGILLAAVALLSMVISYVFAYLMDKHDRLIWFKYIEFTVPMTWIFKALSFNYLTVVITDVIYKFNYAISSAVFETVRYDLTNDHLRENNKVPMIVLSEVSQNIAIAFFYIFGAVLISTVGFMWTFILTGIISGIFIQRMRKSR